MCVMCMLVCMCMWICTVLSFRLNQFKRSQVFDANPFGDDDDDRSQPYASGMGPGLGQRLTVDEIREQQKTHHSRWVIVLNELRLPWISLPQV